jgi:hypothetical protein
MKAKVTILIILLCLVAPVTHATRPNALPTGFELQHLFSQAFGISARYAILDDRQEEQEIQAVADNLVLSENIYSLLRDYELKDEPTPADLISRPLYRSFADESLDFPTESKPVLRIATEDGYIGTLEIDRSLENAGIAPAPDLLSLDLQDRLCLKKELEFRLPECLFNEKAGHFAAIVNTYEDHELRRGYTVQAGLLFSELEQDFSWRVGVEYRRGLPEIGDFTEYEADFVGFGLWIDF